MSNSNAAKLLEILADTPDPQSMSSRFVNLAVKVAKAFGRKLENVGKVIEGAMEGAIEAFRHEAPVVWTRLVDEVSAKSSWMLSKMSKMMSEIGAGQQQQTQGRDGDSRKDGSDSSQESDRLVDAEFGEDGEDATEEEVEERWRRWRKESGSSEGATEEEVEERWKRWRREQGKSQ